MTVDLIRVGVAGLPAPVAVLVYHARRPRSVAIVAGHGYSSSKQNLDGLGGFLAAHGFEVYSLDFPGHKLGASGGSFAGVEDLIAAMQAVVDRARSDGYETVYTLGHSMGAMVALCVAARDAAVQGSIAIATGLGRPAALLALEAKGTVDLRSSYVDGPTLAQVVEEADSLVREAVPRIAGRPTLFLAAERDAIVTHESVAALAGLAGAPKTFGTIDSDHTYAGDNARGAVLAWFGERHPRPERLTDRVTHGGPSL